MCTHHSLYRSDNTGMAGQTNQWRHTRQHCSKLWILSCSQRSGGIVPTDMKFIQGSVRYLQLRFSRCLLMRKAPLIGRWVLVLLVWPLLATITWAHWFQAQYQKSLTSNCLKLVKPLSCWRSVWWHFPSPLSQSHPSRVVGRISKNSSTNRNAGKA